MDLNWFGSELTREELEAATVQHIDPVLLVDEAHLYQVKWFDYRPMHPAAATYLMVHHYNIAYGDFLRRAVDHKQGYVKAISGKDFMLHKERNSLWRLRQAIDRTGTPYDFFMRCCMNWHIHEGFGKGVQHPPRPAHILDRDDMFLAVSNAWTRERRSRLRFAEHPHFLVENWCSSAAQRDYESYLVRSIGQREHKQYSLQSALYEFGHLRIEAAIQHFSVDAVTQAQAEACE